MTRALGFALIGLLTAPLLAQAWGPEGHRIVGQIAAEHLNPRARASVDALLAGEPEPTLAGVANWADDNRTAHPETGPLHYVNFPKGDCHYLPPRDCPNGLCVIGGIEQSIATLKFAGASKEQRLVALKNLVHFVGDVHQPLHAGLGEDRGGNSFKIQWQDKDDNLHRLWDSGLISRSEPDVARYVQRLAKLETGTALVSLDAADWALASCVIAQSPGFYPDDHKPAESYVLRWQPVVDQQLELAGLRLAAWLNLLF